MKCNSIYITMFMCCLATMCAFVQQAQDKVIESTVININRHAESLTTACCAVLSRWLLLAGEAEVLGRADEVQHGCGACCLHVLVMRSHWR